MKHGKGWKRDASGDWRNYAKETRYEMRPEQVRNRRERNAARARLASEGKVHKGDGKEVDHKHALSRGGSNRRSNLQVLSRSANRRKGAG